MNLNVKKEVLENLRNANDKLATINIYVELVVIGAASLIIRNIITRSTTDIDFINKVPDNVREILLEFEINDRAAGFDQTYGEWEGDLFEIESGVYSNIKLHTISIERQAASRMFFRRRFTDLIEISANEDFDFNKFEKYVSEIHGYAITVHENEFNENKHEIIKLYRERGWNYETSNIKKLYNK